FPDGTWTEKLLRHQYDAPPPLRDLAPAVPPAVAAVVERLMAKAPADRYATPAAVAHALEEWLALGDNPPARLQEGEKRRRGEGEKEVPAGVPASLLPFSLSPPLPLVASGPPSAWDVQPSKPAPASELSPSGRLTGALEWLLV